MSNRRVLIASLSDSPHRKPTVLAFLQEQSILLKATLTFYKVSNALLSLGSFSVRPNETWKKKVNLIAGDQPIISKTPLTK